MMRWEEGRAQGAVQMSEDCQAAGAAGAKAPGHGEHGVRRESQAHGGWGELSQGRVAEKREEVGRATTCRAGGPWCSVRYMGLELRLVPRDVTSTPEGWPLAGLQELGWSCSLCRNKTFSQPCLNVRTMRLMLNACFSPGGCNSGPCLSPEVPP